MSSTDFDLKVGIDIANVDELVDAIVKKIGTPNLTVEQKRMQDPLYNQTSKQLESMLVKIATDLPTGAEIAKEFNDIKSFLSRDFSQIVEGATGRAIISVQRGMFQNMRPSDMKRNVEMMIPAGNALSIARSIAADPQSEKEFIDKINRADITDEARQDAIDVFKKMRNLIAQNPDIQFKSMATFRDRAEFANMNEQTLLQAIRTMIYSQFGTQFEEVLGNRSQFSTKAAKENMGLTINNAKDIEKIAQVVMMAEGLMKDPTGQILRFASNRIFKKGGDAGVEIDAALVPQIEGQTIMERARSLEGKSMVIQETKTTDIQARQDIIEEKLIAGFYEIIKKVFAGFNINEIASLTEADRSELTSILFNSIKLEGVGLQGNIMGAEIEKMKAAIFSNFPIVEILQENLSRRGGIETGDVGGLLGKFMFDITKKFKEKVEDMSDDDLVGTGGFINIRTPAEMINTFQDFTDKGILSKLKNFITDPAVFEKLDSVLKIAREIRGAQQQNPDAIRDLLGNQ